MNIRWRLAQAAERRWWKQYLANKSINTYLQQKKHYWHQVLYAFTIEVPPGVKVLDAGCGPAGIFLALDQQQVTAVDPLLTAYDKFVHFDRSAYPWVDFQQSALEQWTIGEPFAWAFCLNAINHVADLELALHRLTLSVRPGGQLLLTVDVHRSSWLKAIFRAIPGDVLHPHQHGQEDYLHRLRLLGWDIQQVKTLKTGKIFDYIGIHAAKSIHGTKTSK